MIALKCTDYDDEPVIIIMENITFIHKNEKGGTLFIGNTPVKHGEESSAVLYIHVKERLEDIFNMISALSTPVVAPVTH